MEPAARRGECLERYAGRRTVTPATTATWSVRPSTLRSRASPGSRLRALAVRLRTRNLTPKLQLGAVLAAGAGCVSGTSNSVGFNSDEAVYAGQAASHRGRRRSSTICSRSSGRTRCSFQSFLSLVYRLGCTTASGGSLSVALGVATVCLVYELGRLLYGRRAGLVAALLLAVMPYHVVVSRQVLLDGPMTFFATLTLLPAGALRR